MGPRPSAAPERLGSPSGAASTAPKRITAAISGDPKTLYANFGAAGVRGADALNALVNAGFSTLDDSNTLQPLLAGRDFTDRDRLGSAPVILVNEAFAERYVRGPASVGARVTIGRNPPAEIVGIAGNAKYRSLSEVNEPAVYEPLLTDDAPNRLVHLLIRTIELEEGCDLGARHGERRRRERAGLV